MGEIINKSWPIFPHIVGVPRSGTTLLRLMLDAHPDMAIPPETHFIGAASTAKDGQALLDHISTDNNHTKKILTGWHNLNIKDVSLPQDCSVSDAYNLIYQTYAKSLGKSRWGDKTAINIWNVDLILSLIPNSFVIHIIRDGRDASQSWTETIYHKTAINPETMKEQAQYWVDAITKARKDAVSGRYMEVRYEDLVADPQLVIEKIDAAIGLVPHIAQMSHHEYAATRLDDEVAMPIIDGKPMSDHARKDMTKMLKDPPTTERIGRFRKDMKQEDIDIFNATAGSLLTELGYKL